MNKLAIDHEYVSKRIIELVKSDTAIPISKSPGYKAKIKMVYKNKGKCV